MQKNVSQFGKLVVQYDAMRPSYPSKAIQRVRKAIGGASPLVLDLGCGTGISTRQLAKAGAMVVGCDIDQEMIHAALKRPQKNTAYILGTAQNLPFRDGTFNAVTIFTALHWFCDDASLREIKRVIKPRGVICIVQPHDLAYENLKGAFKGIVRKHFPNRRSPQYGTRDFTEGLQSVGFKSIRSAEFRKNDTYTLDEYMTLLQSHSEWNRIPVPKQKMMVGVLKKHFRPKLKDGRIYDPKSVKVIIAKK